MQLESASPPGELVGGFELGETPPALHGQPQIEVALETNRHGIPNVGAEDKGPGKNEHITITNGKRRSTEEQIEKVSKVGKARRQMGTIATATKLL